jgi:hypothetical protein
MKKLILLLIFSFSLKAESIYNGICVNTFSTNNGNSIILNYSHGTQAYTTFTTKKIDSLILNLDRYVYDSVNNRCLLNQNENTFYLPYNEFNYLMAVYGIFLSSLIAFGLIKAF